jgi:GntR family transcriptional regulator/MocR family aminotransferase
MLEPVTYEKLISDRGTARIEQLALADFLARGELDRHLRRMRIRYRRQRDAVIRALAEELPEARVHGIAAGLHVTVELSADDDEDAIRAQAQDRRIGIETMQEFLQVPDSGAKPAIVLGYAQLPEPAIRAGIHELGDAVRAARSAQ